MPPDNDYPAKLKKGQSLLLATGNEGKKREMTDLLGAYGILVRTDISLPNIEETGTDFFENSRLKAQQIANFVQCPALADDSGFAVEALDGAPGLFSARWAGPEGDYGRALRRIHDLLDQKGIEDSKAAFICVLSLAWPAGPCLSFEGRVEGHFVRPARGTGGFGYDSAFQPLGKGQTFAEMPLAEKQKLSHRARAFTRMMAHFFPSATQSF